MRFFIFVVLTTATFFRACRPLSVVPQPQPLARDTAVVARADTLPKEQPLVVQEPIRIDYDTVLVASLLRTPCYGICPHYEVRVYASGRVVYHGIAGVDSLGWFDARADSMSVVELLQYAERQGYMNLEESYPTDAGKAIKDFPLCVTHLRLGERRKTVYNRNEAPTTLWRYERYLDAWWKRLSLTRKVDSE